MPEHFSHEPLRGTQAILDHIGDKCTFGCAAWYRWLLLLMIYFSKIKTHLNYSLSLEKSWFVLKDRLLSLVYLYWETIMY